MYEADHLLRLFEPRLAELGMSQAELGAAAFGKADNSAIQALKKGSVPSIDRVEAMARVLGLECYVGPPRANAMEFREGSAEGAGSILAPPTGYATLVWDTTANLPGIAPIAFSDAWLLRHGIDQERHLSVWLGYAPKSGAEASRLAIIDRQAKRSGGPHLWALRFAGPRIDVAQVQFDGGTPMVLPTAENPEIRLLRSSTIEPILLGRVLWHGSLTFTGPAEEISR